MRIQDITLRVSSDILVYPGDPAPELRRVSDLGRGDALTATHLSIGCHVGTHVDAPSHFLSEGRNLDELPLECFLGPAVVLDLTGRRRIESDDLRDMEIPFRHHVLVKTENSALLRLEHFRKEYCYLSRAAAELLCTREPRSVGFDYYSLDPFESTDFPAHRALAAANIPAFVCLDLGAVRPGLYQFAGLPLRLADAEGAPVRAVLLESTTWAEDDRISGSQSP